MKPKKYLLLLTLIGLFAGHNASAQSRYIPSTDGTEITDSITGLIWQRCSQGQNWNNGAASCTGIANTYTYEAALALVQTQTGWRLPNVKELLSIADLSKSNPSIDTVAFPSTPPSYFWSSTPLIGVPSDAWGVYFTFGFVVSNYRNLNNSVRLVR